MKQWFAIHTKPHMEKRVASALEGHDIETYLPETTGAADHSSRSLPFFPGYLFIYVDLNTANPSHWRWTPGARYLVAYGNQPIPIPAEVIALIDRKVVELESRGRRPQEQFEPGDQVRIKNGPFRDMLAVFESSTRPGQRVQLLLQALNRSVRVSVSPSALEKVAADMEQENGNRARRTRGRGRYIRS